MSLVSFLSRLPLPRVESPAVTIKKVPQTGLRPPAPSPSSLVFCSEQTSTHKGYAKWRRKRIKTKTLKSEIYLSSVTIWVVVLDCVVNDYLFEVKCEPTEWFHSIRKTNKQQVKNGCCLCHLHQGKSTRLQVAVNIYSHQTLAFDFSLPLLLSTLKSEDLSRFSKRLVPNKYVFKKSLFVLKSLLFWIHVSESNKDRGEESWRGLLKSLTVRGQSLSPPPWSSEGVFVWGHHCLWGYGCYLKM